MTSTGSGTIRAPGLRVGLASLEGPSPTRSPSPSGRTAHRPSARGADTDAATRVVDGPGGVTGQHAVASCITIIGAVIEIQLCLTGLLVPIGLPQEQCGSSLLIFACGEGWAFRCLAPSLSPPKPQPRNASVPMRVHMPDADGGGAAVQQLPKSGLFEARAPLWIANKRAERRIRGMWCGLPGEHQLRPPPGDQGAGSAR